MSSRIDLQTKLETFLVDNGYPKRVYYQPPESLKIKYPCIILEFDGENNIKANDKHYHKSHRYTATLITTEPDLDLADKLCDEFVYCSYENRSCVDNLYHDLFTIYY